MTSTESTFWERVRVKLHEQLPYLVVTGLILLFTVVYLHDRVLVTVRSGQGGVLYRRFFGGTVTDKPYGEGFYLVWPWNRMFVYNVRNQAVNHEIEVLTKRGLPITVTLTIRYRPEYNLLGVLHQEVGPDYVNVVVKPEVEATIRAIIGQYDVAEVYTTKRAVVQKIIDEALEQASQKYVNIDDVLITKISLPEAVGNAIEQKMVEEQRLEAFEFKLRSEEKEVERKRIEAEGIRQAQRIIGESLSQNVLIDKGIQATKELAQSSNSKIVVVGSGEKGLPLILGNEVSSSAAQPQEHTEKK